MLGKLERVLTKGNPNGRSRVVSDHSRHLDHSSSPRAAQDDREAGELNGNRALTCGGTARHRTRSISPTVRFPRWV
jgi:hypothetical protein